MKRWHAEYGLVALIAVLLFVLAIVIGLGHVEEKSSFGLKEVIQALTILVSALAGFLSGRRSTTKDNTEEQPK